MAEFLTKYPDVFYIWNDALDPKIMPADEILSVMSENCLKPSCPTLSIIIDWPDGHRPGSSKLKLLLRRRKLAKQVGTESCDSW
jgi:hypothetical protein